MSSVKNILLSFVLFTLGLLSVSGFLYAQQASTGLPQKNIVYVAPIKGVIDLGLAPFVERVLNEAQKIKLSQ